MECAEVATYRDNVAVFSGTNKPAVIGHAGPITGPVTSLGNWNYLS